MSEADIKRQVQDFYNQVGWKTESDGFYQNARFEDLRPVAREYIHRCHLRVNRYVKPRGKYLLDAGSGPVQYPEYFTYSTGYQYRVCADISSLALKEARRRLGEKGLYVIADVAQLPFGSEVFDGIVSLHTLHHIPLEEQANVYFDFHHLLLPGSSGVVVNGWTLSPLMNLVNLPMRVMNKIWSLGKKKADRAAKDEPIPQQPTGTFVSKNSPAWLHEQLAGKMDYEILVWRSVTVRFLRTLIHSWLGGKYWLRLLYWLEERAPRWFGEKGQYPLVVIRKAAKAAPPLSEDGA